MLPKQHRLTDAYDFQRLKKRGAIIKTPFFLLNYHPNDEDVTRIGFIITGKIGNAVARNRIARILRAAVIRILPEIKPGYDVVLIAFGRCHKTKSTYLESPLRDGLIRAGLLKGNNGI